MISGYLMIKIAPPKKCRKSTDGATVFISRAYVIAALFLSLLGLLSAAYSASYNSGIQGYLTAFIAADNQLRDDFSASSSEGGVAGYIKLLAYAPLAVTLNISAIIFIFGAKHLQNTRIRISLTVAAVCLILKIIFALDRLTLAALGLVALAFGLKRTNAKLLFLAFLIISLADYISRLRLAEFGIFDFLVLYAKLGLQNLELLIDSRTTPSMGFETFLHPLHQILKFFGISAVSLNSNYSWIWNPAQYFFGYLYLDFSYIFLPITFFIGCLLGYIEAKSLSGIDRTYAIYFVVLYCIISFIGVPALRGLEFWFTLAITIFLSSFAKVSNPSTTH